MARKKHQSIVNKDGETGIEHVTRVYGSDQGKGYRRSYDRHPDGTITGDHTVDQNTNRGYDVDRNAHKKPKGGYTVIKGFGAFAKGVLDLFRMAAK